MNPEKMVELQMQIRHNNDEMLNSLNDLNSWEKEIKAKEKLLASGEKPKKTFPVRNLTIKKILKDVEKGKEDVGVKTEAKRIKGCDYQAWDHFDAKKVCEEIDKDENETNEKALKIANEVIEQAEQIKEEGNKLFKAGRFEESVECYSRALLLVPHNPLFLTNRALAHIKLKNWQAAETDCDTALKIDQTLVKALMRRGLARKELGRLPEAQADFMKVLEVEPANKQSREELLLIQKLIGTRQVQAGQMDNKARGVVKCVYKAPHERSKKPLRRIKITEVGVPKEDQVTSLSTSNQAFDALLKDVRGGGEEDEKTRGSEESAGREKPKAAGGGSDDDASVTEKNIVIPGRLASKGAVKIVEMESSREEDVVRGGVGSQTMKKLQNEASSNAEASVYPSQKPCTTAGPLQGTSSLSNVLLPSSAATSSLSSTSSSSPKKSFQGEALSQPLQALRAGQTAVSAFQFQIDWRDLQSDQEAFFHYFKRLHPGSLKDMFGEFLEADILCAIIHALHTHYAREDLDCFWVLHHLTDVPRFSMICMFLGKAQKQALQQIFVRMRSSQLHTSEQLDQLASSYL